jgi:hypothetical protein
MIVCNNVFNIVNYIINILIINNKVSYLAVRPGFEPGQAEPKSAVLPLHHRTMDFPGSRANLKKKQQS